MRGWDGDLTVASSDTQFNQKRLLPVASEVVVDDAGPCLRFDVVNLLYSLEGASSPPLNTSPRIPLFDVGLPALSGLAPRDVR